MTAGQRATALTRQLLAFSRSQTTNRVALSLNSVVTELEPMLRRLIRADIRIQTALDPSTPVVVADATQLEQVLMNLAVNARDAMPRGGTLTIAAQTATLGEHSDAPAGEYAVLRVSDTGVGMKPEDIPVALAPFRQLDDAFNRRYEGTGLGLALAKMLTDLHGGVLEITSAIGLGTTVNVHLPCGRILSRGNVAGDKVSQSA